MSLEIWFLITLGIVGFVIALTSGQQRWIKTLDLGHLEVMADTDAGLSTASAS